MVVLNYLILLVTTYMLTLSPLDLLPMVVPR
jgi:hypothetical protein